MAEQTNDLGAAIADCLEKDIEPYLESIGLPLSERPFRAAIEFTETYVQGIDDGNGETYKPAEISDFVASPAFRIIFQHVEKWYKDRFGTAMTSKENVIKGAVMAYGVPFIITIPAIVSRPGKPGDGEFNQSVWIRFPSTVLEGEDVSSWIVKPPNLAGMPPEIRNELERDIKEVSSALRSIRTNFMGAGGKGPILGLQKGTIRHLETFVDYISSQDPSYVQKAYWELQMAAETAFKAVAMHKTGKFRETHDLFTLYDDVHAIKPLSVSRDLLKSLPRWKETTTLRYAVGSRENVKDCFNCYLITLRVLKELIEDAALEGIHDLGSAEFEIGRPPWFGA